MERIVAKRIVALLLLTAACALLAGCRASTAQPQNREFFTSGSRDADQRASQRMAKAEQLAGTGEGAGEKGVKAASPGSQTNEKPVGGTNQAARVEGKLALFDRLGGQMGISNIVADFTPRVLDDPRVNWGRKGVTKGGFSLSHAKSVSWQPTPEKVELLQRHLTQFIALATGGPAHYDGQGMKSSHASLHIANAEFDAAVGDLKASLDRLRIPNTEQKELLSIIESTRPEIVEER